MVGAETVIDPTATSASRRKSRSPSSAPRLRDPQDFEARLCRLPIARIVEVHDRTLVFDEKFARPCSFARRIHRRRLARPGHWLIGNKLDELHDTRAIPPRAAAAERRLSDPPMLNRKSLR